MNHYPLLVLVLLGTHHMTQVAIALLLVWYAFDILIPGRTR